MRKWLNRFRRTHICSRDDDAKLSESDLHVMQYLVWMARNDGHREVTISADHLHQVIDKAIDAALLEAVGRSPS